MPGGLTKAKTGRDGEEWWISPPSSCSLVLSDIMAWCSQLMFSSLPWARWGAARRHLLLPHCWQYPLCPRFPPDSISSWEGLTRQAQNHPHHVDFGYLALLALMLLGFFSNNSHILPPKWYMNDLKKLLWAVILKQQFWAMLVQAPLWEAGTPCLLLSLRASWSNMLVLVTGFKGFCCFICIYLKSHLFLAFF